MFLLKVFLFILVSISVCVCNRVLVPLYIYPSGAGLTAWRNVANTGIPLNTIAIINPNSGPVAIPNSDYVAGINALKAKCITILGYVYTSYGARDITLVKADIDTYASWNVKQRVNGIFFDEASTSTTATILTYYQTIRDYVKLKFGTYAQVVTNQGTNTPLEYVNGTAAQDTVVIFEDSYTSWSTYVPDSYVGQVPESKLAIIVHTATATQMNTIATKAKNLHIGNIYVTNDIMPNPYDTLPTFYSQLVQSVNT